MNRMNTGRGCGASASTQYRPMLSRPILGAGSGSVYQYLLINNRLDQKIIRNNHWHIMVLCVNMRYRPDANSPALFSGDDPMTLWFFLRKSQGFKTAVIRHFQWNTSMAFIWHCRKWPFAPRKRPHKNPEVYANAASMRFSAWISASERIQNAGSKEPNHKKIAYGKMNPDGIPAAR